MTTTVNGVVVKTITYPTTEKMLSWLGELEFSSLVAVIAELEEVKAKIAYAMKLRNKKAASEGQHLDKIKEAKDLIRKAAELDILYVREIWSFLPCATCGQRNCLLKPTRMETADGEKDGCILYRADGENPVFSTGHIWRPSIHMPKKAARIFLRVTDVRMERLRAVNFFDCIAEGMPYKQFETEIIEDFRKVWDRTIKPAEREKYGWDANPWVWAYTFQRE